MFNLGRAGVRAGGVLAVSGVVNRRSRECKSNEKISGEKAVNNVASKMAMLNMVCKMRPLLTVGEEEAMSSMGTDCVNDKVDGFLLRLYHESE